MARAQHTPASASPEEAITLLLCLIDDAYASLTTPAQRQLRLAQEALGLL